MAITFSSFVAAISSTSEAPEPLSDELRVLWLIKKDQWEAAHDLASDINTPMGSRLHGLLHTIEGDLGNAGYWYSRANAKAIQPSEIEEEWQAIARELTSQE